MRQRPHLLTEHDKATWATFTRLVRPLPGRAAPAFTETPPFETVLRPSLPPPPIRPGSAPLPHLVTGIQPPGLDNASWSRFRGGRIAPARTLDLHGKTVQNAYHALERFLHAAHADRLRCVEIITGRGSGEFGGAIRRELPIWLALPTLRPLILAAAHPHAANPGATRLLLKRR